MKTIVSVWLLALAILAVPAAALAQGGTLEATLSGYEEVPTVSTRGKGQFTGVLSVDQKRIDWTLSWNAQLTSAVTQAHIHFAQAGVNGGVIVFLCTDLGNGPLGTPLCPDSPANFSGDIVKADVIALAGQNVSAMEISALVRAIRAGTAYVNVHTTNFPGGEIRGQIQFTPAP